MAGEVKPSEKPKVDEPVTEEDSTWLDAHYDPVASLNTLTSCMVLEDLSCDGDHKVFFSFVFNRTTLLVTECVLMAATASLYVVVSWRLR